MKKLVELNLVPLLNKMKNILSLWSSRNLTLMGKITIVKSLIIPRMIYKASILPLIIPKTLITKINKLLFKFIWGSNWERVSRNILCNNIESGGAKMLHLESYLTALHVKSSALLFDETYCSQWKFIENLFFDRNLLSAILLSNIKISSKTIQRLLPLRSLIVSFTVLLKFCNNPVNNASDTFLWLNKSLKYKGRPLYIKEFSDAGIVDAQQIVDINGNFKSYHEIATEYNLIPNNRSFIEYIKFISVVPHRWQLNSVFDNQRNEFIENVLQNLQTYGKSTKSFYDYLFSKIESLPRKQQTRWNEELNLSISTDDWSTIYKCNYDVTPETKLRSFQIKLNLRAVVTNIVLHGLEITTTDKCTFCDAEKETLLHLFCTCVKVASFWENVSSWIESKLKYKLVLKPCNMLFGVDCNHKLYTIINCLLLHARFLIFRCKTAKNIPNLSKYFLVVQNAKTLEKRIAQKYNRLDAYRKKWSMIL